MQPVTLVHLIRRLIHAACVVPLLPTAGTATADTTPHDAGATTACRTIDASAVCDLDVASGDAPRIPPLNHAASTAPQESTAEKDLQALIAWCRSTYAPPDSLSAPAASQKGGWYYTPCADELGTPSQVLGPFSFIPDSAISTPVLALALQAQRELVLPIPSMFSSPGPAAQVPKVVNFPTWAWIDEQAWAPVTATASVPAVSVSATATPQYVDWSWGDGHSTTCQGPGTPFSSISDPAAASPDCGHTYAVTSKTGPGLRFPVTATIHWRITWQASTGRAGQFPDMTSRATQAWPVEEIDALAVPANETP
jgi:hypothetical protein